MRPHDPCGRVGLLAPRRDGHEEQRPLPMFPVHHSVSAPGPWALRSSSIAGLRKIARSTFYDRGVPNVAGAPPHRGAIRRVIERVKPPLPERNDAEVVLSRTLGRSAMRVTVATEVYPRSSRRSSSVTWSRSLAGAI